MAGPLVALLTVGAACSSDGGESVTPDDTAVPDDTRNTRQIYRSDEVDGVHAVVADCFVVEDGDGVAHYSTTVEVHNNSEAAHTVAVTIDADSGRGGTSDAVEITAGGADAWAVVGDEPTTDPLGDVECTDYITDIGVIVDA